ncbi:MAG: acyltransferase family protein [Candidatus Hodarchaeota archaeon]
MTTLNSKKGEYSQPEPTLSDSIKQPRIFYLDNLRIYLIILVILHHTAVQYFHTGSWYYKESYAETTLYTIGWVAFTLFCAVNQAYFMGFFFLISGYFTPKSFDKKGGRAFLQDRVIRLGIPLIFYAYFINPMIVWALWYDHLPFWDYYGEYWDDHWGVGPLWFVLTLLIFNLLYTIWRLVKVPSLLENSERGDFPANKAIVIFMFFVTIVAFLLRLWIPAGDLFLNPKLGIQLGYYPWYVALFIIGITAYRLDWLSREKLSDNQGLYWLKVAVLTIPSLFIAAAYSGVLEDSEKTELFEGGFRWQALSYAAWESVICVGICMGLLVLFRRKWDSQGPILKAMSASAYTVFIIHAAVIVGLGIFFMDINIGPFAKFAIVSFMAVVLGFSISHFLIRRLPLANRVL